MVDILGLTIFLIGVGLIVLELSIPGYFIGVGGTALVTVGLVQMAYPDFLFSWWSPFVVVIVVPLAIYVSVQFYKRIAPPGKPETYSSDRLVGETGRVVVDILPNTTKGKVKVGGIVWSADALDAIPAGTVVTVRRVEGVHLIVERAPVTSEPPLPAPEAGASHGGEIDGR